MISHTPPRDEPDEDHDVIVQLIRVLAAPSLAEQPNPWSVFVGSEWLHDCGTREEAETFARALAVSLGVRAWTLDEAGHPMQPIELQER
jgi:hypothetical protein